MNLLPCFISSIWLLLYLTASSCRPVSVKGFYGDDIVLPCKYDWRYHGKCEICWMKGDIPASGCGDEIIATDGDRVTRRTSSKYTLRGDIQKGDVSLTIIKAGQNDSGKYGCRVHVPGWFNDKKITVHVSIAEEPVSTAAPAAPGENSSLSSSTETVTSEPLISVSPTQGIILFYLPLKDIYTLYKIYIDILYRRLSANISVSQKNLIACFYIFLWSFFPLFMIIIISGNYTNSSLPVHNRKDDDTSYNMLPGIMVSVLLLLGLGLVAIYLLWKQKTKSRETFDTSQDSVLYSNLNGSVGRNSSVGLNSREMAVENVYQIESENEYERWS
uniref:Hepatitis A virus cellular receptor 1 n=1 Tax=Astyanax mexicanus TaxID=7994 RepID=A0A3B1JQC2_ASTMX